ncbi:MAG: TolB-like translocation protein [Armatimonadota bacterium]
MYTGMRILICIAVFTMVITVVGYSADGLTGTRPQVPVITRESKIPTDAVKVLPHDDRYPPMLHSTDYYPPVALAAPVNTAGAEDSPYVSPDGNTLWFVFIPDVRVPPEKQLLDGVTGMYVTRKKGKNWGTPTRVVLNTPGNLSLDGGACVQGDTMWFCSARIGNFRGVDMWTAKRKGNVWLDWTNAGKRLNEEMQIGEVHVMPNGRELYYHADRPGGKGKLDIWVTRLVSGVWQDPVNVEVVNSEETDGWPFVTYDGKELWITRWYKGSPALFRSKRVGNAWTTPELIVSQFAGEPTLDKQGNLYFVHHYYRDNKMIEADIYVARPKSR